MFARASVFSVKQKSWNRISDRQTELYSRRNCLLIHGIKERSHKVTDKLVVQTIKSEMDIDIDVEDTDQIHPRGEKSRK